MNYMQNHDNTSAIDTQTVDPTEVVTKRSFAFIIDLVIEMGLIIFVWIVGIAAITTVEEVSDASTATQICYSYSASNPNDICETADNVVLIVETSNFNLVIVILFTFLILLLNQVMLSWLTGGSLGKLMLGIRVVNKNTFRKASFGRQLLRFVSWIIDSIPWFTVVPLVGLLTILISRGHRRVGDMLAGTLVVKKEHLGRPLSLAGVNDKAAIANRHESPINLPEAWKAPDDSPPPTAPSETTVSDAPRVTQSMTDQTQEPVAQLETTPESGTTPKPETTPESEDSSEVEPASSDSSQEQSHQSQPGVDAPMWDEARNAYIQWDPEQQEWMQWSETQGRWNPISV